MIKPTQIRTFVDGAQKKSLEVVGGIVFDGSKIILSWGLYIGASPSSTYAEARAILEGIFKCHQLNITSARLYIDSQQI